MSSSPQASGLPPSSVLGGGNLALSLRVAAASRPDRVAITHGGRSLTVGELAARSGRAAALLAARGVGRGDRVAIQLPNVPAFVDFYFAALRLGAVVVPVNPLLRAAESAYTLEDAEARVLIAWHESEAPEGDVAARIETVRIEEPFGGSVLDGFEGDDAVAEVDPADTAVILYTSGTTGRPKGAELTHRNLGLNTRAVIDELGIGADDVLLGTLPLFHSFGQTCTLNSSIAVGARLALLTRFDAAAAVELVEREGVTILMGVPTMLAGIAAVAADHEPSPDCGSPPRAGRRCRASRPRASSAPPAPRYSTPGASRRPRRRRR